MLADINAALTKIDRAIRNLRSVQADLLKIREEMPMRSWCPDHVLAGILQDSARSASTVASRVAAIIEDAAQKDKG